VRDIRDRRAVDASIRQSYPELMAGIRNKRMTRKEKTEWEAQHHELIASYNSLGEESLDEVDKVREALVNAQEEARKGEGEASETKKVATAEERAALKERRAAKRRQKEESKEEEKRRKEEEKAAREEWKKEEKRRKREREAEEHLRMKEERQRKSTEHDEEKRTVREVNRKALSVLNMLETILHRQVEAVEQGDGKENEPE
jgi:colicin import membrane protein